MMLATFISCLVCLAIWLKDDRKNAKMLIKKFWHIPVLSGFSDGLLNFFVILLATMAISPSIVYPVISVGGLLIVTLFSKFAFKEKLKLSQWIGIIIGAIAVAILSI